MVFQFGVLRFEFQLTHINIKTTNNYDKNEDDINTNYINYFSVCNKP